MSTLKKIPFFLVLLVLFFCLHGSVENYGYLHVKEVIKIAAFILLGMAVFFAIVWLFTKNYLLAALITIFVFIWYLFFGAAHDLIKTTSFLHFLSAYAVLLPVLLVFNVAVIWWLKRNPQLYQKLFLYLNILFLLFCVVDGFFLLKKYSNYQEVKISNPVSFNFSEVTDKPNVYFLLFDEYAGYKSLQDSFGFKNDSLYQFLQQQQFTVMPGFSNYDFTPYSMSSVLNMQYVPQTSSNQMLTQSDIQHRFGEIRNAQVPAIFKQMGYTIENYSVFDFKNNPALAQTNGLFPIHAALLTNKIFHKRLVKDIGWWFVTGKFQIPFFKKQVLYKDDDYNKKVVNLVLQTAKNKTTTPSFIYAHLFLPHGQYFRDSIGALNSPEQISDLANKSIYLSYLKYTNKVIKKLVSNINANDPNSIVIIMSDHGFYDYNVLGDYHPFNFDNICMVKQPASDSGEFGLPASNVNFFRYLFNTAYKQNIPYVKDSTVFVIEDGAFK